jgi:cobaltochelatase CobS
MSNLNKKLLLKFLHTIDMDDLHTMICGIWSDAEPSEIFIISDDPRTKTKTQRVKWMADTFEQGTLKKHAEALSYIWPTVEEQPASATAKTSEMMGAEGLLGKALEMAIKNAMNKIVTKSQLSAMVQEEIKKLPPYRIQVVVNDTPIKELDGYARPELSNVLELAAHRLNILMVGPAGCGKTFIARQVADALDMRFGSISCSAGMSESHLTGWLLPRGDNGRFEYVKSVFVDIYENGGVFLFDEMDAADSNTLLFVNQALANGGFFLPQRFENPEVKKHPDCIIMAAANTYGTGGSLAYAGRERLDEATLDRFRAGVVQVGYDRTLEETLVDDELLKWGHQVRRKINEAKLQRVMSTRFLIDATKLKRSGKPMKNLQDTYFHGWREDERRKVAA